VPEGAVGVSAVVVGSALREVAGPASEVGAGERRGVPVVAVADSPDAAAVVEVRRVVVGVRRQTVGRGRGVRRAARVGRRYVEGVQVGRLRQVAARDRVVPAEGVARVDGVIGRVHRGARRS
jgi:hypothetical protein